MAGSSTQATRAAARQGDDDSTVETPTQVSVRQAREQHTLHCRVLRARTTITTRCMLVVLLDMGSSSCTSAKRKTTTATIPTAYEQRERTVRVGSCRTCPVLYENPLHCCCTLGHQCLSSPNRTTRCRNHQLSSNFFPFRSLEGAIYVPNPLPIPR